MEGPGPWLLGILCQGWPCKPRGEKGKDTHFSAFRLMQMQFPAVQVRSIGWVSQNSRRTIGSAELGGV